MSLRNISEDELRKLAENAAPDEKRLMPSQRTYVKTGKTVSVEEAIARMQARKKHKEDIIPGGLDDQSPRVQVADLREKKASVQGEAKDGIDTIDPSTDPVIEPLVVKRVRKGKSSIAVGRYSTDDVMTELFKIQHQSDAILKDIRKGESEEKPANALEAFLKGRHRVTFLVNGMEFSVACLNMIKDMDTHTLVLAFDASNESFFVPPAQSELSIKYDNERISGKLFYFGMCFTLKEIGIKFLGFLYDDSEVRSN